VRERENTKRDERQRDTMKRTGSEVLALTAALTASSSFRESKCLSRYSCTDISTVTCFFFCCLKSYSAQNICECECECVPTPPFSLLPLAKRYSTQLLLLPGVVETRKPLSLNVVVRLNKLFPFFSQILHFLYSDKITVQLLQIIPLKIQFK